LFVFYSLKMKRIILFLGILCSFLEAQAQQEPASTPSPTFPRHSLQIGIGDPTLIRLMYINRSGCPYYHLIDNDWFSPDTYRGKKTTLFPISLSYSYSLKKWLALGGMTTYNCYFYSEYERSTRKVVGQFEKHFFAFMPTIHFTWLNKKIISLYSGGALGVAFLYTYSRGEHLWEVAPAFQLTFIGIRVGKTWYGFGEYGVGVKGFLATGVGYKF
jgi:hypothetical protein